METNSDSAMSMQGQNYESIREFTCIVDIRRDNEIVLWPLGHRSGVQRGGNCYRAAVDRFPCEARAFAGGSPFFGFFPQVKLTVPFRRRAELPQFGAT